MNCKIKYIIILFFLLASLCAFAGCEEYNNDYTNNNDTFSSDNTYTAFSDFFYSTDKGVTYSRTVKEFDVGETVYLKLKIKILSTENDAENIGVTLTIPNITVIDAKLFDGQPITPKYNWSENTTCYEFNVIASANAQEWDMVFKFIPNTATDLEMQLQFDDKISASYDQKNEIRFVGDDIAYITSHMRYQIVDDLAQIVWCDPKVEKINIGNDYFGYPITQIADGAFSNCNKLQEVILPDSIVSIGSNAFGYCGKLNNIQLPPNLTYLGEKAFNNCASLSGITIPSGVKVLKMQTFLYCNNLKKVIISSGVTEIEAGAFDLCTNLEAVYIPKSVEILPYGELFDDHCTALTVYCESISRPITWPSDWFDGLVVWGATDYFGDSGNDENPYEGYETDVVKYEINTYGSICVRKCDTTATKVMIYSRYDGRRVETIAQHAFENCYNLIDVIIPDSIYTIEQSAFKNCLSLEVIYIPKSVKYIESKAFEGCSNLTIYCEAESKPRGWSDSWFSGCGGTVIWGSKRTDLATTSLTKVGELEKNMCTTFVGRKEDF